MADAVDLLDRRAVRLNEKAADRDDAIRHCGQTLGVAIPHGTLESKAAVRRDALAVLRFPDGVDWGGHPVSVCVAIAAQGDGHVDLLAELAEILLDPDRAAALRAATDVDEVIRLLAPGGEDGSR